MIFSVSVSTDLLLVLVSTNLVIYIKNILKDYFPPGYKAKAIDTPLPAHPTYKHALATSSPLSLDDLRQYEGQYHGPYNITISKLLHIQQWSRLDLNYVISRLAVFLKAPTAIAFKALDHLMNYLLNHLHEPIFYPSSPL